MNQQVDSKTLFVKQVQSHAQSLCDLLGCDTTAAAPGNIMDRCAVATRMLTGTSSLMGFAAWEQILASYEDVLVRYNETGLPWDERIAQVTSELIEKEESLVAAHEADPAVKIENVVGAEELGALQEETLALLDSVMAVEPIEKAPRQPEADTAPPASSGDRMTGTPAAGGVPTSGLVKELERVYQSLIEELYSDAFRTRDWSALDLAGLRSQLHFLDFYACSIEQLINRSNPTAPVQTCNLTPLRTALNDFAREIARSSDRACSIVLTGEETEIDPRLLSTAGSILQRMVTDVFNRSEGAALGITVNATRHHGALHWQLRDDGDNFINDSQLDHEDQLAFYPGLRDVRKLLGRHHGLLWVESRDDRKIRFEFTLPVSKQVDSFVVWGNGTRTFGVRAVQLCDLFVVESAPRGVDSYGEYLSIDNKRVPLLKLDVFFNEAPSNGEMIAVIGSLEKRVAFYVPDAGVQVDGKTLEGVIPVWQGPAHLVAQVENRRIALLDADQIIEEYLDLTGELNDEGVSGGVVEDESELSNSQVIPSDSDVKTPPDQLSRAAGADVLIVEQSESLRTLLQDILDEKRISSACVGGVEEAVERVQARPPRLIISEFRMPAMAAKVLVEALRREGKSVPVLVTTSQSGKTADLLVEKLGAAGYLSKPLDRSEVVERVKSYLAEHAPAA